MLKVHPHIDKSYVTYSVVLCYCRGDVCDQAGELYLHTEHHTCSMQVPLPHPCCWYTSRLHFHGASLQAHMMDASSLLLALQNAQCIPKGYSVLTLKPADSHPAPAEPLFRRHRPPCNRPRLNKKVREAIRQDLLISAERFVQTSVEFTLSCCSLWIPSTFLWLLQCSLCCLQLIPKP